MAKLDIHLCPETGICSVIKENGSKIDMLPTEVDQLRQVSGDGDKTREILASVDRTFSEGLEDEELDQLCAEIK